MCARIFPPPPLDWIKYNVYNIQNFRRAARDFIQYTVSNKLRSTGTFVSRVYNALTYSVQNPDLFNHLFDIDWQYPLTEK